MAMYRKMVREFHWFWAGLLLAAVASTIVTSCGGGGDGGTHGELCDQCGQTDGGCKPEAFVNPTTKQECASASEPGCETRKLICRRKSDSAQQRCFPADSSGNEVDFSFRCDGSRPGNTPGPQPTPTVTVEPSDQPTPTCGNDVREGNEECDLSDFDEKGCGSFCSVPGGILNCTQNCTLDFSLCLGPQTCSHP